MFIKYLALLRGINVGGNNLIKKDDLKSCFEAAGCTSVYTYIQSGNILFTSSGKDKKKIAKKIQVELKKKLKNEIQIIIFSEKQFKKMLKSHPPQWGKDKDQKHNALFLLDGMSRAKAKKLFPEVNQEYEQVSFANGVVFWSGSRKHYTKTSYVKKLVKSPLYKQVTIRNSNTTFKILDLFDEV